MSTPPQRTVTTNASAPQPRTGPTPAKAVGGKVEEEVGEGEGVLWPLHDIAITNIVC